jgi:hypothetical protein
MRVCKDFLKGLGALAAALLFVLPANSKAQDSSSPHDKLMVWAGHWKIHIETKATQFSHAKVQDFDSQCSFLPSGGFMVCEYLSLQPDPDTGRVTKDVAIVYYSDVDKTFKYTNVAPEGGPHENLMHIDGNAWIRPYKTSAGDGKVIDAREIYTFVSPDKHQARFEVSTDKGAHWIVINEAIGTKAS